MKTFELFVKEDKCRWCLLTLFSIWQPIKWMLSPQLEPSQFSTSNVWFSFHAAQIHQFWFCNYPLHLTETERREHRVTEVKSSSRGKGGKNDPSKALIDPSLPLNFHSISLSQIFPHSHIIWAFHPSQGTKTGPVQKSSRGKNVSYNFRGLNL